MTIFVVWEEYFPNRTLETERHLLIKSSDPTSGWHAHDSDHCHCLRAGASPSTGQDRGVLGVLVGSVADTAKVLQSVVSLAPPPLTPSSPHTTLTALWPHRGGHRRLRKGALD